MVGKKIYSETKHPFIGISLILILLLMTGCTEKAVTPGRTPAGQTVSHTDCKASGARTTESHGAQQANQRECLEYTYDGISILSLNHINACFNCCPGKISSNIHFQTNEIQIEETESEDGCRCLCLIDIRHEVKNLNPGLYRLIITGPGSQEILFELNLDLRRMMSGTFCIERSQYPWL